MNALRIAALTCLVACTSLYAPRQAGRLALVYDGGTPHLTRDGQRFGLGSIVSDGEALQAVAGVPAAEDSMRGFLERRRWGSVLILAGSIAATAGAIYLITEGDDASKPAGYGLLLGGTGLSTGGLFLSTSGVARLFDAINQWNDSK